MALNFEHVTLGQRVRFGHGQAAENLAAEVDRLNAKNVMVIAGERELDLAREVAANIEVAAWHSDVVMHVPVDTAEKARAVAAEHDVDLLVSVGGGSTTGLAKAVALTTGIPIIAVPTTYAGSEATDVWGLTEAGRKTTGVDARVLPETVIYDSALMLSLPVEMSVASGLNGMAHCIDSLWGPKVTRLTALAAEGIRALSSSLPRSSPIPRTSTAATRLYGAYPGGVFRLRGLWPHHRSATCSAAPSICRTPRPMPRCCPTCANAPTPRRRKPVRRPLAPTPRSKDCSAAPPGRRPQKLSDYGFTAEGLPRAVEIVLEKLPANNPGRSPPRTSPRCSPRRSTATIRHRRRASDRRAH